MARDLNALPGTAAGRKESAREEDEAPVARDRSKSRSQRSSGRRRAPRSRLALARKRQVSLLIVAICVAASVAATGPGRAVVAAMGRFLLLHGGVIAMAAMTASVGIGLLTTDRIVMTPGRRMVARTAHRAISLAAVAFLVTHISLEIAATRSRIIGAVVPFLARDHSFPIGLGVIASDLILVIVVSGLLRPRFAERSQPRGWRALHATAYAAWLLAIIHGLLTARGGGPSVAWSYGVCAGAVGLALVIRGLAVTRRGEEPAPPARDEQPRWPSWPASLARAVSSAAPLGLPPARPALPPGAAGGPLEDAGAPKLPRRTPGASRRRPSS